MNEDSVKVVMASFARLSPHFAQWRRTKLEQLAGMGGTTPADEAKAMRLIWLHALQDATHSEVLDVLEDMERGKLPVPVKFGDYSDAPREIGREISRRRSDRHASMNFDPAGRRYHCTDCWDSGVVEIFHPAWIRQFRDYFTSIDVEKLPGNWFGRAQSKWRRLQRGPLHHAALCDCECPAIERLTEQRDRMVAGRRSNWPACGAAKWNRKLSPKFVPATIVEDLQEFYGHEAAGRETAVPAEREHVLAPEGESVLHQ